MKVYACMLTNDNTGSSKVGREVLNLLLEHGHEVHLFSSENKYTFTKRLIFHRVAYRINSNLIARYALYLLSQVKLFIILSINERPGFVYINTLQPFGAMLFCIIFKVPAITHVHECYIKPKFFMMFLHWLTIKSSRFRVYVSEYLRNFFDDQSGKVIHNCVSYEIESERGLCKCKTIKNPFNVVMLSSPVEYKGLKSFYKLSVLLKDLKDVYFTLVLNSSKDHYVFINYNSMKSTNFNVIPKTDDVNSIYRHANLIVNLTDANIVIESFGMTILEGMAFGIPSIVPQVGGPSEIIKSGITGYSVDTTDLNAISTLVREMYNNSDLYRTMSNMSYYKYEDYARINFNKKWFNVFDNAFNSPCH